MTLLLDQIILGTTIHLESAPPLADLLLALTRLEVQRINFCIPAAILTNLLLGSQSADEAALEDAAPIDAYGAPQESYGAPASEPVNSYGAPAPSYEEPAPAYEAPSYEAPAPAYEAPQDTYGSPAAEVLPSYNAPSYALSY